MNKVSTINAVSFILSANMDAVQAKALKLVGDAVLDGIFTKATKGMDDKAKAIVDNPASRIAFVNAAVGLAHSHRVPEMGMVSTALFASTYGSLMDAAEGHMDKLAGIFTKSCLELQLPASVENEALAMVAGVKAGNPLETVFNEAKGGVHIIELPADAEVKAETTPTKVDKPAPKSESKAGAYMPKKESELKSRPKNLFECPVCGKNKKKDKLKVFHGTEMGVGDEWKEVIICAECKHGFTTESDKLKKSKAEEYAAVQAEAKRKETVEKSKIRIEELTKEIAALVSTKEYQDAKHQYDAVAATGVDVAADAVIKCNPNTLGKFEELQTELEKVSVDLKKSNETTEGKQSAIADIVAQAG